MSFFKHYFAERNPNLSSYETTEEMANKYKGDDYILRFVKDFDDEYGDVVNKVGVNTRSGWNNPRGIYGYWVDDINDNVAADYGRNFSKAYILKRIPFGEQIIDIGNLGRTDYKRLNGKLKDYAQALFKKHNIDDLEDNEFDTYWKTFLKIVEKDSDNKSDGGILFYSVVRLAQMISKDINRKSDVIQTEIWRKGLGVTFIGDKGTGIIHPNEEAQVVFLSPKAYKVIDSADNKKKYDVLKGTDISKYIRRAIFKDNVVMLKNVLKQSNKSMDDFASFIAVEMYNRYVGGFRKPAEKIINYVIDNAETKKFKQLILKNALHYGHLEDVKNIEKHIERYRWGGSDLMVALAGTDDTGGIDELVRYLLSKGIVVDDDVINYAKSNNVGKNVMAILQKNYKEPEDVFGNDKGSDDSFSIF